MTRAEALTLLGLDKATYELIPAVIAAAFRRAVMASHPDTTQQGDSNTTRPDMDLLRIARKTLLDAAETANNACAQCRGRGSVRHQMGTRPCGACKGTGETYGR